MKRGCECFMPCVKDGWIDGIKIEKYILSKTCWLMHGNFFENWKIRKPYFQKTLFSENLPLFQPPSWIISKHIATKMPWWDFVGKYIKPMQLNIKIIKPTKHILKGYYTSLEQSPNLVTALVTIDTLIKISLLYPNQDILNFDRNFKYFREKSAL